jgi:hypothetical protein
MATLGVKLEVGDTCIPSDTNALFCIAMTVFLARLAFWVLAPSPQFPFQPVS